MYHHHCALSFSLSPSRNRLILLLLLLLSSPFTSLACLLRGRPPQRPTCLSNTVPWAISPDIPIILGERLNSFVHVSVGEEEGEIRKRTAAITILDERDTRRNATVRYGISFTLACSESSNYVLLTSFTKESD